MFKLFLIVTAALWSTGVSAQQFTINGKVQRVGGTQILSGASVEIKELNRQVISDDSGNFNFTQIQAGQYTIVARFLGFTPASVSVTVPLNEALLVEIEESYQITDEVIVYATRANDHTPTTYSEVSKEEIQKQNFGQDLPMVLNWTPSMVTTSDAGAGIGYTGMRIRGSDATRINVTINGISLNDSESQGVFWVNTPDIASSVQSVQVQRGVGTSTNGSGAFGATVSILTDAYRPAPFVEATASAGSFNSRRFTVKAGTGLIDNRWAFEGRVSDIRSDGYLDRASSKLNAYHFNVGYYGDKTIIKAVVFGGHEQTYQAWNGIDPATMAQRRTFNYSGAIYDDEGNVIDYYDNEVDDYRQDHAQLHFSHRVSENWSVNLAIHSTYGRGFFEQYKQQESFSNLGLPDVIIGNETITSSDVIVRRWLDNDYYGSTFSVKYDMGKSSITLGGAYNVYDNARHFGEVIWSEIAVNAPLRYVYYDGESKKSDFNVYAKWNYAITAKLSSYLDVQFRNVNYKTAGTDDDQAAYSVEDKFDFFNPKAGITYAVNMNNSLYASYAIANREPNRSDYLDGSNRPTNERLGNLEIGWKRSSSILRLEANYYLMNYTDQLVLTGEVSDTGYPTRANIGKSYRTGVELAASIKISNRLNWNGNVTWSVNRNEDFTYSDENNNQVRRNTNIILSPEWIGGSQLGWLPFRDFQAVLLSKFVGKQYLDNTENEAVKLDEYFINDIRLSYQIHPRRYNTIELSFLLNNLFDIAYSSNGYGYDATPYYFPQAGINFLGMLTVKLQGAQRGQTP